MTTFLDFLEVWADLKLEDLSTKQIHAFKTILEGGIKEIEEELERRKQSTSDGVNANL